MAWIRQTIQKRKKRYVGILTTVIVVICLFLSISQTSRIAFAGFFDDDLEIFEEVFSLISDNYVYPPTIKNSILRQLRKWLATLG